MRSSLSLKDSSTESEETYFLKLNANLPEIERVGVDEGPGRTSCLKSCWQPGFMMVRELGAFNQISRQERWTGARASSDLRRLFDNFKGFRFTKGEGADATQLTDLSFIISVVGELRLRGRVVGNKDAVHVVSGLRV